jgi:hypothetical protein
MRRFSHLPLLLTSISIFSAEPSSEAQGTLNALTFGPGIPQNAHVTGVAVGWSFVPTADILVSGVAASGPQITFWQGSGQPLATFPVTSTSWPDFQSGVSRGFDPTSPVLLLAEQLYFVSCQETIAGAQSFPVYSQSGTFGFPLFQTSSYISQFACYSVASDGTLSPIFPTDLGPDLVHDLLCLGPNFQFQLVPEPPTFSLLCCAISALACVRWFCKNSTKAKRAIQNY